MYRTLIQLAVAAVATVSIGSVAQANSTLAIDDATICKLLEAAHEASCDEFVLVRSGNSVSPVLPAQSLSDMVTTGGIGEQADAPFVPRTVPVNR